MHRRRLPLGIQTFSEHDRTAGEPGIGLAGVLADLLDHAKTGEALPRLADVQHPFRTGVGQALLRDPGRFVEH
jgi:hypothetical protein